MGGGGNLFKINKEKAVVKENGSPDLILSLEEAHTPIHAYKLFSPQGAGSSD